MEHNRDCDTIGEVYGNCKFADFPLNVDYIWQKKSSQGNQYNGITISNQKQYTDCRVLRRHSGAMQAHQTNGYGSPQYESTRLSWLACWSKWTSQNEKTRAAKPQFLVPNTWKSWKSWGSHPNTDTNPQKLNWAQRERKTQSTREHKIPKKIPQTIWMVWYTSIKNREASNWSYPGRLSWHFR